MRTNIKKSIKLLSILGMLALPFAGICKTYKADIVIVEKQPWTVTKDNIRYKCGWSPLEGVTLTYKVRTTIVNGRTVYDNGAIDENARGELLTFHP